MINPHQPQSNLPAPLARPWLWFALPALSTFLLNAVTLHLSTDFTPIPNRILGEANLADAGVAQPAADSRSRGSTSTP